MYGFRETKADCEKTVKRLMKSKLDPVIDFNIKKLPSGNWFFETTHGDMVL